MAGRVEWIGIMATVGVGHARHLRCRRAVGLLGKTNSAKVDNANRLGDRSINATSSKAEQLVAGVE
ncbi:MAG: hypothetical protein OXB95_05520 [Rhodobacteraceae bacterium]|nr:hypothetical protein [Paracoccaceae bacterium]